MTKKSIKPDQRPALMKPRHEVADVVLGFARKHQERFKTTRSQRRILENILHCRTIGMGGHSN